MSSADATRAWVSSENPTVTYQGCLVRVLGWHCGSLDSAHPGETMLQLELADDHFQWTWASEIE